MKRRAPHFSMAWALAAGFAAASGGAASAASAVGSPPATAAALPADLVAKADAANTFPSFCDIPAAPTNIRSVARFRSAVVETRLAGARVVAETGPSSFSLEGTDAFAAAARAEATPPAPIDSGPATTDEFLRDARARALAPGRDHRIGAH